MSNLTNKDIDILCDALESWERKDDAGMFLGGMLTSLLSKDAPPEMIAEMKKMDEEREAERERKTRERKEKSIILRAKLIMLKENAIVEEASKIVNKS